VRSDEEQTAEDCIEELVGKENIYAFSEKAPGRKRIKPGDRMCFYATTNGVVAHAEVASWSEKKPHPAVRHSETFPWVFKTKAADLYLNDPVVIDANLRGQLNAFENKNPNKNWAWFVQTTHRVTKHDFDLLTRGKPGG